MDGGAPGGGGGPAPFLLKTFEMVDDASTNNIVSWSSTNNSFVVWNPPDFAACLLPTYFKHNNFSSFIRQLNTYGFRKIDPERWEFANEDFVRGQKHLLKNIYRRKPIHSHSNPPVGCHADAERTTLDDEIERLNKETSSLETNLLKFKQQQSGTGIQLEVLERRLLDMEQRQLKMIAFVQQATQNPRLLQSLVKMATALSIDASVSVIHKKRRLPSDVRHGQEVSGNNLCDDHNSTNKPEIGYILDQDFCDKLRLGLCSAIPDDDLVIVGTQSTNEDNCISQTKQTDCVQGRVECLPLVPEILEPRETGLSICLSKNDLLARVVDGNTLFPCQLNLTLASSAVELDCSKNYIGNPDFLDQGIDTDNNYMIANAGNLRICDTERGNDLNVPVRSVQNLSINPLEAKAVSTQEVGSICNETSAIPSGGVNDVFWQQFLTERPGYIEVEEASSMGANAFDYQNKEKVPRNENKGVSEEYMEDLKL